VDRPIPEQLIASQINRKNETSVKWINPSEISARILTLLDESDERVIIVSPYMKISKWYKFVNKINELKTRRILTEIYVRDGPDILQLSGQAQHKLKSTCITGILGAEAAYIIICKKVY
jgi:hypothetical protein